VGVVTAPQLLPRLSRKDQPAGPLSLLQIGAIDYEADPGKPRRLGTARPAVQGGFADLLIEQPLKPLRSGGKALDAIEELFRGSFKVEKPERLEQKHATEQAVRDRAMGRRCLVFSTHGLVERHSYSQLPLPSGRVPAAYALSSFSRGEAVGPHPWLMCGLALSGANKGRAAPNNPLGIQETDDGVLTGLEIAELKLAGTDLVFLGACSTNVGPTMLGEGVIGLQRAFETAGARSVVTTLWNVNEGATDRFTQTFFQHLWKHQASKLKAFQQAQLATMKRGGDSKNPYHWAAWTLSGHPGD
jgi:hypothetical protein